MVEDMAHFLLAVQRSMLSGRRTQAHTEDFLQALHEHSLSLRALIPHLAPPIPQSKSQIEFSQAARSNGKKIPTQSDQSLPGGMVDDVSVEQIPEHFPKLPSQHTYRATSNFYERELNPREIREKATEEGRLGEEALRRFVGAVSAHCTAAPLPTKRKKSALETKDERWRKTMEALGVSADGDPTRPPDQPANSDDASATWSGHLGAAVNVEKKYWRTAARK